MVVLDHIKHFLVGQVKLRRKNHHKTSEFSLPLTSNEVIRSHDRNKMAKRNKNEVTTENSLVNKYLLTDIDMANPRPSPMFRDSLVA